MTVNEFPDEFYLQKSKKIKTNLKNIDLRALHPLDIISSKIGRLSDRDRQDIDAYIQKFRLTKNQVKERAERVQYAGNDDVYNSHLKYVLDNFFGPSTQR